MSVDVAGSLVRTPISSLQLDTDDTGLGHRFAQELLTTFADDLGEVALQPSSGGAFFVKIVTLAQDGQTEVETLVWDRKARGGFPGE